MNKPFTIQVKETEANIIKEIENSKLPVYVLKQIINEIYKQLDIIDKTEIDNYKENIKKKGNDKNAKN